MTLVVPLVILMNLSSCAGDHFKPTAGEPSSPCPPLKCYSEDEEQKAFQELQALPPDAQLRVMLDDYKLLRDQCRPDPDPCER